MDNICKGVSWILPIHDAGIVTVTEARRTKLLAVEQMQRIAVRGESTLYNYLKSINVDDAGMARFGKLLQKVRKLNEGKPLNITPFLLK